MTTQAHEHLLADAKVVVEAVSGLVRPEIVSAAECETYSELLREVKTAHKVLAEAKKAEEAPHKAAVTLIGRKYESDLRTLIRVETSLKSAIAGYQSYVARVQAEQLDAARRAAAEAADAAAALTAAALAEQQSPALEQGQVTTGPQTGAQTVARAIEAAERAIGAASSVTPAQTPGVFARAVWKWEVTDMTQVPVEYLVISVNKTAVDAEIKNGTRNIPGLRIYQDTSITVRGK